MNMKREIIDNLSTTHLITFDTLSNGRIQVGIDGWLLGVYDDRQEAEIETREYLRLRAA